MLKKAEKEGSRPKTFETTWYFANPKMKSNLTSWRIIIFQDRETNCNTLQQEKLKKTFEEKLKKSSKAKYCTKKPLQNCKSWHERCTIVEELQEILKKKCKQDVRIVKTKLAYYADIHKVNKLGDLFIQT